MFSNLIHSGTNYAKRKPIARMFPALMNGDGCTESNWEMRAESMPDSNLSVGKKVFGTFAERNAKPERKKACAENCTTKSLLASDSTAARGVGASNSSPKAELATQQVSRDTPSSQPEFKVGDLVEHMPIMEGSWCNSMGAGKIGIIIEIIDRWFGEPCSAIQHDQGRFMWPLRALRHAETEPSEKDGWNKNGEEWFSKCGQYCIYYFKYFKQWSRFTWINDGWNSELSRSSWLELKRAMEQAK